MNTRQGETGASDKNEIVRCNSCRAAISSMISRCPYCGQRTTGSEQPVSQLELSMKARAKASERRLRSQCKMCGRAVPPEETLCSKCEARDKLKIRITVVIFIVVLILGFYLFAKYI